MFLAGVSNCDSIVLFVLNTVPYEKLSLSFRVEQNEWPFKFSFQPEYLFGKMSSLDTETFTFLYWAEWNREKNDLARPRKPKLEVLVDNWLNQTWFASQK